MRTTGPTASRGSTASPAAAPAALRAARWAARSSRGYRAHLVRAGVDPGALQRLDDLPYLDKRAVFGEDFADWLVGGGLADAAELITSSGQSGHFAIGVTSQRERGRQRRLTDLALRQAGAGIGTATLLVNCLPMGIAVPTALATVATPSVHPEMALEILARLGPSFDRVIVLAEPLFLKELAERGHEASGWIAPATCWVGGEWVAESWRRHVCDLLGVEAAPAGAGGILVSMGAAELGLHALHESPALRAARGALDDADARRALFGRDPGYGPSLFTYDPTRMHLEERSHPDGGRTLVVTTLDRRLLPLVRYDLDDLGEHVDAGDVNRALEARGVHARVDGPVVAVWGRRGAVAGHGTWRLRPERVKEALFADPGVRQLTGRFRLEVAGGGPRLHLERRPGAAPYAATAARLGAFLQRATGTRGEVVVHAAGAYPFHAAADWQHKPRYLAGAAVER